MCVIKNETYRFVLLSHAIDLTWLDWSRSRTFWSWSRSRSRSCTLWSRSWSWSHYVLVSLTSLSKIVRWSESPWNQSGMKGKGLWRKGFAEEPSLEFRKGREKTVLHPYFPSLSYLPFPEINERSWPSATLILYNICHQEESRATCTGRYPECCSLSMVSSGSLCSRVVRIAFIAGSTPRPQRPNDLSHKQQYEVNL